MANEKSKNSNSKKTTQKKKGAMPDYRIAVAKPKEGTDEVFWTRIGSAWNAKDGGISCTLNALPLGDRFMLFPNTEDEESEE